MGGLGTLKKPSLKRSQEGNAPENGCDLEDLHSLKPSSSPPSFQQEFPLTSKLLVSGRVITSPFGGGGGQFGPYGCFQK